MTFTVNDLPQTISVPIIEAASIGVFPTQVEYIVNEGWFFQVPAASVSPGEQQRIERQRQERRMERLAIETKAKDLFLSCLTEKQREQYDSEYCFKVVGSSRGRYVIDCTHLTYNVTRMRNRHPAERLCAAPPGVGSSFDVYLAQKMLLESDEQTFLSIANVD